MKQGKRIYQALKKKGLSDKDIAEAYVLPSDLTPKQKAEADKELRRIRKIHREVEQIKQHTMYGQYKYLKSSIDRLKEFGIAPDVIFRYLHEDHRFYHTWDHIEDLFTQLEDRNWGNDTMFLATIYHDSIYNPTRNDNEKKSAELFKKEFTSATKGDKRIKDKKIMDEVVRIILDTKTHKPTSTLSRIFCEMDMNILTQPLDKLIDYENKIFKEFQCYDWNKYKQGRLAFLKSIQDKPEYTEIKHLVSYIEARKPKIAVYPGSFNPFHIGHYNILQKAEQIFDKVIIARGKNPDKKASSYPLPEKIQFRQQETYSGLLTDFAKGLGYDVTIIRGLRNATDFQGEITQYRFLQDLDKDIKTVSIFCDKDLEHISSSAIRQLSLFNNPKSKYKLENRYLP